MSETPSAQGTASQARRDGPDAHVAPWKKKEVADLVELLKSSPVVGLANVDGIPSTQMHQMRRNLRQDATIKISKNTLLALALKEVGASREGIEALSENIDGSTAIVATKMRPHGIYRRLEGSKTQAPIKAGQKAPEDIKVPKGETQFKPGPIVGDLQKVGIPAAIDAGKVVIKKDAVVLKAGEAATQDLATALTRLEILPMTVGMDLKAVYEDGTIYGRDLLSVDPTAQIQAAAQHALNLAVFAAYPTKGSIQYLLAKAYSGLLGVGGKLSDEAKDEELTAALESATAAAAAAPAAEASEEKEEEEEEEEEGVSEEEAAGGLGALFG